VELKNQNFLNKTLNKIKDPKKHNALKQNALKQNAKKLRA
jgi:hypothetical protein